MLQSSEDVIEPTEGRAGIGHSPALWAHSDSPALPWADPAQHLPAVALQTSVGWATSALAQPQVLQVGAAVI